MSSLCCGSRGPGRPLASRREGVAAVPGARSDKQWEGRLLLSVLEILERCGRIQADISQGFPDRPSLAGVTAIFMNFPPGGLWSTGALHP